MSAPLDRWERHPTLRGGGGQWFCQGSGDPSSHRTVDFDDPIEAAEIIQFAGLLLRQVERAKRRQAAAMV